MKQNIHPELIDATIKCACGNLVHARTTHSYSIEVCAACHPIFNGSSDRLVLDTEGRVERFKRRYAERQAAAAALQKSPN